MYHYLKAYKGGYADEASARLRVAAVTAQFLALHASCIASAAGGEWDTIAVVPSSGKRSGVHPLVSAIGMVSTLKEMYAPLLTRGPGVIDRNSPAEDGYIADLRSHDRSVLLVDDLYVTGARAQSAAHALTAVGATA